MGMIEDSKSKSFEDVSKEMDDLINSVTGIGVMSEDAKQLFEEDYAEMLELEAKRQSFMWTLAKIQAINYKLEYSLLDENEEMRLTNIRKELTDSLEID